MKIGKSRFADELVDGLMGATMQAIGDFEKVSGAYEGNQIGNGLNSWSFDTYDHASISVVAALQSDENWTPNIPDIEELRIRFRNFVELSERKSERKRLNPILCQLKTSDGVLVNVIVQAKFQLVLKPRRDFGPKR